MTLFLIQIAKPRPFQQSYFEPRKLQLQAKMDRRLSMSLPNGGGTSSSSVQPAHQNQPSSPDGHILNNINRLNRPHYPAPLSRTPSSHHVLSSQARRSSIFLPIPESPSDSTTSNPQFPTIPEGIYINRPKRSSSIMSFGPNSRKRIMILLDEVRKKRELRDRRKSDMNVTYYLDDIMFHDDGFGSTTNTYRKRKKLYQFLNHPSGAPWAITYHIAVFLIVFICLILTICATIPKVRMFKSKLI